MPPTWPGIDRPNPRDRRLLVFLLLSLLLHVLWLALPLPRRASPLAAQPLPAMTAHLTPTRSIREAATGQPSPEAAQIKAPAGHPHHPDSAASFAAAAAEPGRGPAPPQDHRSAIDLDGAYAAARSIAKEERPTPAPPPGDALPLTVEAAVAKATRPDVVVESRGANGEWVTQDRKSRCVARIQRKWFEEGVPMLTLCELKKG